MATADAEDHMLDRVAELLRTQRGQLAALARAEGVTPEDAVDCVQEGVCTLLANGRLYFGSENGTVWGGQLATMVRNAARNRRRRHDRARPHEAIDDHARIAAEAPASDELIARAEAHVRLHACVQELCEIQQAVVTLRMLEEQAGEDVARALGISPGHVAVLLHRAKAALRACMATP